MIFAPQIVREEDCRRCREPCCRFTYYEPDFHPVLTKEEYENAVEAGARREDFACEGEVYRIRMVRREGPHLICPFNQGERCTIQEAKPVYCRLWPLLVAKNNERLCLVADMTQHCPATDGKNLRKYAEEVKRTCGKELIKLFSGNPSMGFEMRAEFKVLCTL